MDIVFELVSWGFYAYYLLIFIYIIMSWIPQARESAVAYAIARLVEPYLSVFRSIIPPIGMIDISPIVALIALRFVEQGVYAILKWVLGPFML
ncbi:YggT family protein [Planifilum fimeticola]|jgi:YggT family protein|uniref:YggT family protein n=1 Tax=Planifilum fimeticola TaxID=201975 RepID=A0A2T0LH40_9BACL|nr:YggT family protein [Planifilum fimeticola]PRX41607.1 YggT family protein [Planifilum fimeticola]